MKALPHIGTVEQVSLPDYGLAHVPAKIDTGADNSAIWASNIRLANGQLHFNLFAAGSAYYNGEPHTTTAFRTTTVKNSFGHKEFRYKIRLTLLIGTTKLTRWFTLADRSNNTYPILLGKNFLKNKFIVDVAQKNLFSSGEEQQQVLIFTEYPTETQEFFEQVRKHNQANITYGCVRYSQLYFDIDAQATRVLNTANGRDISEYSFTYFKNHKNRELSASAAAYLHYKGRPFADQEFVDYMSASKLTEYLRLSNYGISVPRTICASNAFLQQNYGHIVDKLGSPFVLKEIRSDKGKFNFLIASKKDYLAALGGALDGQVYCAQQYIPNDGFYRMYVMGKEVVLAIWRSAVPHKDRLKTHLNKPRGSANAVNVPLGEMPGEAQDLALRAANCMNRQVAGADIVQDNATGQWYVLEVNNDPQLRSGSFIPAKAKMVAKYFDKELNQ